MPTKSARDVSKKVNAQASEAWRLNTDCKQPGAKQEKMHEKYILAAGSDDEAKAWRDALGLHIAYRECEAQIGPGSREPDYGEDVVPESSLVVSAEAELTKLRLELDGEDRRDRVERSLVDQDLVIRAGRVRCSSLTKADAGNEGCCRESPRGRVMDLRAIFHSSKVFAHLR